MTDQNNRSRKEEDIDRTPGVLSGLGKLQRGDLVSVKGLADIFQCHTETIKRRIEQGQIPRPWDMPCGRYWTAGFLIDYINQCLQDEQENKILEDRRIARLPT